MKKSGKCEEERELSRKGTFLTVKIVSHHLGEVELSSCKAFGRQDS